MKISYNYKELKIFPENEFERLLIKSEYLKTKLAFSIVNYDIKGLQILIVEDKCDIDIERNIAYIDENLSEKQMGYFLRVIIDVYVLKYEAIPLHASLIASEKFEAFLFGRTNCGKTVFSNYLYEKYDNYNLVGDDHIIVSDKGRIGNLFSRIRSDETSIELFKKNTTLSNNVDRYFVIDIDIRDTSNSYEYIYKKDYLSESIPYVLKYIVSDFDAGRDTFFISDELKNNYFAKFESFLENAIDIIRIRGSVDYVTTHINTLITSGNFNVENKRI